MEGSNSARREITDGSCCDDYGDLSRSIRNLQLGNRDLASSSSFSSSSSSSSLNRRLATIIKDQRSIPPETYHTNINEGTCYLFFMAHYVCISVHVYDIIVWKKEDESLSLYTERELRFFCCGVGGQILPSA